MPTRRSVLTAFGLFLSLALACRPSNTKPLLVVSTTSTQDSGLFDRLVPAAEKAIGRKITIVAVGSGEALAHAERGDADVVIAHSPAAEEKVVAEGHLIDRMPLMFNRFILCGPDADPAKTREAGGDLVEAMKRIRASGAMFVSRGDQSGTHKKEQELWKAAGLPDKDGHVLSTGQGQGETVQVAAQRSAYVLCDSATWGKLHTAGLVVLLDTNGKRIGPVSLTNPYHVMRENPAKHPDTHAADAKRFVEWVTGPEAAAILSSGGLFTVGEPPKD